MLSTMKRLVGNITVKENGDLIEISGLPADTIAKDIRRIWGTSKITVNMFTKVTGSFVSFQKFFAPDILYTMERILDDRMTRLSNRRALIKIVEQLKSFTWLKSTLEEHEPILDLSLVNKINLTLLPHQLEFLRVYNRNVPRYRLKGYLLSSPAGTGKTITGLALSLTAKADRTIIVSPNNAIYKVWGKTINENVVGNPVPWISQDKLPLTPDYQYYVFHYESLSLALEFVKKYPVKNTVIILDESHNFNEITSLRTNIFVELCKVSNSAHVIWSSGTPLKSIGVEAIPLLRTIDSFFNNKAEEGFRKIFGKSATKALDILAHRLGLITFKVEKSTVVDIKPIELERKVTIPNGNDYTLSTIKKEMSEFIDKQMKFYLSNMKEYEKRYEFILGEYRKTIRSSKDIVDLDKYNSYVKIIRKSYDPVLHKELVIFCNQFELKTIIPNISKPLANEFKDIRSIIKYVDLKVQGECLGRVLGKKRTACNVDLVESANLSEIIGNSIKKTVVFTSYVEVVKKVNEVISKEGFKPVLVYGETNSEITKNITTFEKQVDANPIVATYQSLSTAVPLIVANTIVCMNLPFRDHEYTQAVSRCARLGQDTQVYVFKILLDTGEEPNISTRSSDIMEWSKAQVEAMMGRKAGDDIEISTECFGEDYSRFLAMMNKDKLEPTANNRSREYKLSI